MLMDKIDEENPINSLKNSYNISEENYLIATAIRKSQDERSSTAKDIVEQLIGMEKQLSKDQLPFGDSFETNL